MKKPFRLPLWPLITLFLINVAPLVAFAIEKEQSDPHAGMLSMVIGFFFI